MNKVGQVLTHKLGPLPAWGWGVIVIAGVVFYLRRRATSSGTSASTASGGLTSASVPFGGSSGGTTGASSSGYAPTLSDQLGTLTQDVASLQGLNQQLGLGPTGNGQSTTSAVTPPAVITPVTAQYGAQLHQWWVDPLGNLMQKWQDTGTGQWFQQQIGQGWSPAAQLAVSQSNGFTTVTGQGAQGTAAYATQPIGSSTWTSVVTPPAGTPTNSSGGLISGGNPAPVQPPSNSATAPVPA